MWAKGKIGQKTYGMKIKFLRLSEWGKSVCLCEADMNYGGEQWQEAHMTQPSLEQQRSERKEGGGVRV